MLINLDTLQILSPWLFLAVQCLRKSFLNAEMHSEEKQNAWVYTDIFMETFINAKPYPL